MLSRALLVVGLGVAAWLTMGLVASVASGLTVNIQKLALFTSVSTLCLIGSIAAHRRNW